jgi:Ca2+-binding RTX toxin-like protein
MSLIRLVAVSAGALALALPTAAQAGTVTRTLGVSIAYQGAGGDEGVRVGVDAGVYFVESDLGATTALCTQATPTRAECGPAPTFVVNVLGGADRIDATRVTDGTKLQANAGDGDDRIDATNNDDTLSGGVGGDYIADLGGNDQIDGGPGGDVWIAGTGTDVFTGGDGDDTADYSGRANPVAIVLNGQPVSGEAGENDAVGADVEGAFGGAGNDTIVGNALGNRLSGGGGNDTITGGAAEDRVEGQEGDDRIDTRDGRFDSIDCGAGTDTLLADPGDSATNCEIAPDRDGDGTLNEQDCAPDNAAIHPGAGEIVGNAVDEDCVGGPQYLRVNSPLSYTVARRQSQNQAKFVKLTVAEIKAGDTIDVRCTGGKSKGCPFSKKTQTGKAGKAKVNLVPLLKQRYLKRNAVLEIRITRPNEIGRVTRLTVTKRGVIKSQLLCLAVGATKPGKCG